MCNEIFYKRLKLNSNNLNKVSKCPQRHPTGCTFCWAPPVEDGGRRRWKPVYCEVSKQRDVTIVSTPPRVSFVPRSVGPTSQCSQTFPLDRQTTSPTSLCSGEKQSHQSKTTCCSEKHRQPFWSPWRGLGVGQGQGQVRVRARLGLSQGQGQGQVRVRGSVKLGVGLGLGLGVGSGQGQVQGQGQSQGQGGTTRIGLK